ncbi:MAG: fasciclin domain-containing protein [Planctomycetes bacterium]|nr:fasciclin domain-containing protein [Planctomycetota bacterium]
MLRTQSKLLLVAAALLVGCSNSNDSASSTSNAIGQTLSAKGFPTLQAAIDAAGLTDTLTNGGDFTLLAPTEAAFAALPAGTLDFLLEPANLATLQAILQYHVISGSFDSTAVAGLASAQTVGGGEVLIDSFGGNLRINEAQVTDADILASNGVIHAIDTVLMPPMDLATTLQARGFSTLLTAIDAAGLTPAVTGTAPLTVLAPTDAAFANLPAGVLNDLLMPANQAQLADILTYHVVDGAVKAGQALAAESPKALNGVTLLFAGAGAGATVNGVTISTTNIPCTNGVIHQIDAVLLPPGDIPTIATTDGFSTLVAALTAADLVDDLQGDGPFTVFAPTDAAFAALPAGVLDELLMPANQSMLIDVLLYHVVADELTANEVLAQSMLTTLQGSTLDVDAANGRINTSDLVATNVLARNGIVHAINSVLIPPGVLPLLAGGSAIQPSQVEDTSFATTSFATVGEGNEPLWFGSKDASEWVLDRFQVQAGSPAKPTRGEGATLFFEGLGSQPTSDGSFQNGVAGDLRIALGWDKVPTEVQLDLLQDGQVAVPAKLVYLLEDGRRVELEGSWKNSATGASAVWSLNDTGRAVQGADLILQLGAKPITLRGLRLHTLR